LHLVSLKVFLWKYYGLSRSFFSSASL
jgi:hypothetical protein